MNSIQNNRAECWLGKIARTARDLSLRNKQTEAHASVSGEDSSEPTATTFAVDVITSLVLLYCWIKRAHYVLFLANGGIKWTIKHALLIQLIYLLLWWVIFREIFPLLPDTASVQFLRAIALINGGLTVLLIAITSLTPDPRKAAFETRDGKQIPDMKLELLFWMQAICTSLILISILACYAYAIFSPDNIVT